MNFGGKSCLKNESEGTCPIESCSPSGTFHLNCERPMKPPFLFFFKMNVKDTLTCPHKIIRFDKPSITDSRFQIFSRFKDSLLERFQPKFKDSLLRFSVPCHPISRYRLFSLRLQACMSCFPFFKNRLRAFNYYTRRVIESSWKIYLEFHYQL